MPKLILGLGRDRIVVDNPRWGVRYSRVRTVTRVSTKVKAINVCTKYFASEKKVDNKRASASVVASYLIRNKADELKAKGIDVAELGEPAAFKLLQGYAMAVMLEHCKANADTVCEKAAHTMGLKKETCKEWLSKIEIKKTVPDEIKSMIKSVLGI